MDRHQDPEAWADAFLDAHRSGPRRDPEREHGEAARALRDLPAVTRWLLTHGGREPDLETIQRIQRSTSRQAMFLKWEAIFTMIGIALLCLFGFALLNTF